VKAVFLDRVNIIALYDRIVHSPTIEMRLPSVIALKDYVQADRNPAFTRFNVFLRDGFTCQYCCRKRATPELTFDHLIPRCKGGRTTWANVVTACSSCNLRKGSHRPQDVGMWPRHPPYQPSAFELQERGRGFPPNFLHHTWRDYLYWDSELEL
jgi:5-methylcytosine-specific restriction endonuclease McrA